MASKTNISPDESAADLEAAFSLALTDALRATDKPTAALLEVCRKAVDDNRAQQRWLTEQAQLVAGASTPTTSAAPTPAPSRVVHGIDLDKLPFPVKSRGVETPPAKPAEPEAEKPSTWAGLSQVPFMSPEDH